MGNKEIYASTYHFFMWDKLVRIFSRCKCDEHSPKDNRTFLSLDPAKHLNVIIDGCKADWKLIFTMIDSQGAHEVPNGCHRSDGVPTPQRESSRSTCWAKNIDRYCLQSLRKNILGLRAYVLRRYQRPWQRVALKCKARVGDHATDYLRN